MKKYISLMNPYSFYYLWNSEFKFYLENLIKEITGINEKFELVETFNSTSKYLKSYIFLEGKTSLIYIDFNKEENNLTLDQDLIIFNYLKIIADKKILLIIFNSFRGRNDKQNNIYQIYKSKDNNNFLKLLLGKNFKDQIKTEYSDILNYLYNLNDEFYLSYLREEKLRNSSNKNIYKSRDI